VHGALHAWIAFLKRWKEAKEMSDLAYPPVQQALKKLQDLSRNEEDRYRAIARERALYNELTLLRDAREEGREEGLREGHQEGRQEGLTLAKTATLTRQLTRRFGEPPEWASKRVQEASGEQIDAWLDRILDAPTLQAVFDDR
jgi:flagellar biosynthesis/type III secretory pathway protein FliH